MNSTPMIDVKIAALFLAINFFFIVHDTLLKYFPSGTLSQNNSHTVICLNGKK